MHIKRRVLLGIAALLLAACGGRQIEPEFSELPTVFRFPSMTPIPSATFTPSPVGSPTPTPTETYTPTPTATPVTLAQVVIAVQPIPVGVAIPPEAVKLHPWPQHALPLTAITDLDAVIGQVSLVAIACFEPILNTLIAPRTIGTGYDPLPGTCDTPVDLTPYLEQTGVVIATQYIATGTVITPGMIAIRAWPAVLLPPGAVQSAGAVIGRSASTDMFQEQPILTTRITSASDS